MSDSISTRATKAQLRTHFRQKRKQLNRYQQRIASLSLCKRLKNHPSAQKSKHIALYLPNDGEIDPTPIIDAFKHTQKQFYLPVILRSKQLVFAPYRPTKTPMKKNRFGILEPSRTQGIKQGNQLDLVLMPLVAFDTNGGRLGMGGGFYDRTFAFKNRAFKQGQSSSLPKLVGIAHSIQEAEELTVENWDIYVDYIVTDKQSIRVR